MSEWTPAHLETVAATCRENLAAVCESLTQCFDLNCRLELGTEAAWTVETDAPGFSGPGLVVSIGVGDQGLVVLIPTSLPLPDWYTKPGDSENARLQTLPMEWSMNLLPADLEAGRSATVDVADLWTALKEAAPAETARMLELLVFDSADQAAATTAAEAVSAEPRARLLLVWPVARPLFEKPATEPEPAQAASAAAGSDAELHTPSPIDEFRERARRLFRLPVVVSVRLAEKRIAMGQLLSITPGALITFNKSCEDLLDLYVNNRKYCRGEAVKIGENFGLKLNEVGVVDVRKEKIL